MIDEQNLTRQFLDPAHDAEASKRTSNRSGKGRGGKRAPRGVWCSAAHTLAIYPPPHPPGAHVPAAHHDKPAPSISSSAIAHFTRNFRSTAAAATTA